MRKNNIIALLVVAFLVASGCVSVDAPSSMPTSDVGDAAIGRTYAANICASCHAIGRGEMNSPNPLARPFDAVANTPGMTHTALNAWLHSSHTSMPDFVVEQERVDDLYAYFATLRR